MSRSAAGWRIVPRPLLETILNNHAHHHRVPQPLLFHGPRGVGKTSLLLHRLLPNWNDGPHLAGYVDFASDRPWSAASTTTTTPLSTLRSRLECELESLVHRGIRLGVIGSRDVFSALNKWHGLDTALRRAIGPARLTKRAAAAAPSALWSKAVLSCTSPETPLKQHDKSLSREEEAYVREALDSLRLAKEVIETHKSWRREAVRHLNRTGGFSRSLANSATDWPCLLIELLSDAAEVDFFQPKLILNNIDVLRKAVSMDDSDIPGGMYHDSLIWRLINRGVNERCMPVFLVTSDSVMQDSRGSFEDIVDAYLAYLQVAVVNPAMESAMAILQKFASDAHDGKIQEDRLPFGAPWRHPPRTTDDRATSLKWAKIQLMDFVQSFVDTEFGLNYLADYSLEIFDDPSAVAMLEVGLLHAQRDPSFIRPITRGIQRCLVRWLVHERMQMGIREYVPYIWQRMIRGRSYRHLMKEIGYK